MHLKTREYKQTTHKFNYEYVDQYNGVHACKIQSGSYCITTLFLGTFFDIHIVFFVDPYHSTKH